MKEFERPSPSDIEDNLSDPTNGEEKEPGKNISRRSFLRRAGKAAIAVGIGAYTIGQDGNTKVEVESAEQREGEKNWEMWRDRLLAHLQEINSRLTSLDAEQVIKTAIFGWRTDPKQVIASYKKSHNRSFTQTSQLIDQLSNDIRFHKLLPALVKSLESSFKKRDGRYDMWYYGTELEFIEKQIKNILYADKMEQGYGISIKAPSKDFFMADVEDMYNDLQRIPPFTVRRTGVKEIYLDESNWAAGSAIPGFSMELKSSAKGTINHEISHYLDFLNENLWRFWKDDPETKAWRELNKGAKPYDYHYGFEVIIRDKLRVKNPDQKIQREEGYAEDYGQEGGLYEDRATVSENLFKLGPLLSLVERSTHDPILKKKVEFITGYHLDSPVAVRVGRELKPDEFKALESYRPLVKPEYVTVSMDLTTENKELLRRALTDESLRHAIELGAGYKLDIECHFGTPVSEEEYKQAGFPSRDYWSEWSRDNNGKVWMDADYYNAILNYKIVTFSEDNGQTIRHVRDLGK